ncbi:hypothetical protein [Chryseobacterium indoltheticum]|uniref:DUF4410 domain-containing protein n=1 Tax=Chryseobacterium indoltheticum TaxID=254 RepID=A0A381F5F0_9FLAO|nr:hypothetical protein [Chryseobacterium indoltheticum]AZA72269.1 hypothetical protein EG358_00185 [Chryseobacterium indoltheticum]SIR09072.1 hypothetical protein SAMN05421682_11262 [Chryseobacterium indoltheticum]SUX41829.1 Uncharacterised protein [Chryseobacterium indoltheticum]
MKKLFLVLLLSIATTVFAQNQMNIVQGSFDFLRDQTEVNVQVKYENAVFQVENFTEEQYLEKRKEDILANRKRGEEGWQKWNEAWNRFKDSEYLDYLLKGINSKSKKVVFKKDAQTKYTVIVDAKWIYAGWHGGLIGQEAKLTSDITFVETENPSKVIMKLQGDKILGKPQNKDFVMEYGRIAGAYEATGKELGKAIKKSIK